MSEISIDYNFNDYYKIDNNEFEHFDTLMLSDTKLFVDPFMIFEAGDGLFENSHDELIAFFNTAFELAAKITTPRKGNFYNKLKSILLFPEVKEACLGYCEDSIGGSGSGEENQKRILIAMEEAIKVGHISLTHFEEIGLLSEGIGCDIVSDITLNILKERFIKYTQLVCDEYKISTKPFLIKHAKFNSNTLRWVDKIEHLPSNPFYKNTGVILVPSKFLRELPVINKDSFSDYAWYNENETIREDFNYDIKTSIDSKKIIDIAKEKLQWVEEYIKYEEQKDHKSYDFTADKIGALILRNPILKDYVKTSIFEPEEIKSNQKFLELIDSFCDKFIHFIENNQGYELLWDDRKTNGRREKYSQTMFYGLVKPYCQHNDIDINKESNVGKGPVDFKFSSGYKKRILLEVKLARNTKYWNGLAKQLPAYMEAEEVDDGVFLIIIYTDSDIPRVNKCKKTLKQIKRETGKNIIVKVVDARYDNKISASNL